MTENIEQLRTTLRDLEAELASLETLDEETRAMLQEVAGEIQAVLATRTATQPPGHVRGRLRDAIDQFETSHPTLTGVLSRLVDTLGQMGI